MTAIFREYGADDLEHQYMPAFWPGVDTADTIERWIEMSGAFHRRINVKPEGRYGDTPRQSLDVLSAAPRMPRSLRLSMVDTGEIPG